MAGMLFVVCVPTAEHEYTLLHGSPPPGGRGPLINLDGPAVARVDPVQGRRRGGGGGGVTPEQVPMERLLDGLLKKLKIEHVVWCSDKSNTYYQVFFPLESGDSTENCLHSLTELKIGFKHNSVVSVVPCNVFVQGMENDEEEEDEVDPTDKKMWDNFVDSVRAKLTVKQVVDGVRGGATVNFDYVTLILTADMVAVIGLVESNAVNIVAAMLISPLMGPVMALTFGTAISDRNLQWIGIKGVFWGGVISLVFGFIIGLLVGATENPWGYGNWPTDEMLGRGNYRSLWIGVLWALPSGTGVALALLQGMAGPLIGVAISASLLPPIVNCGLLWGLTCTKLIYGDKMKIPHLAGEAFNNTFTRYKPLYSDYLPYEFVTLGIISFCLTLVNIGCIFITAIIVLKPQSLMNHSIRNTQDGSSKMAAKTGNTTLVKLKEVAAPYTSSADLRRFWEHDIPIARDNNRMSTRRGKEARGQHAGAGRTMEYSTIPQEEMETLEVAMREAMNDDVFRRVKRCSYAHGAADLPSSLGMHSRPGSVYGGKGQEAGPSGAGATAGPIDPAMLDQLITSLLGVQAAQSGASGAAGAGASGAGPANAAQVTAGLTRFRPMSRSLRFGSTRSRAGSMRANRSTAGAENALGLGIADTCLSGPSGPSGCLATIQETQSNSGTLRGSSRDRPMSLTDRALNSPSVRAVVQAVAAAPQRLGVTSPGDDPLRNTRFSRRGSETTSLM